MKLLNIVILFLITIFTFSSLVFSEEYSPQHQKALEYFKSGEESPPALDAIWTMRDVFKVGVKNDGSNRDGFKKVLVQIIDYNELMKTGKWVKLGEAYCW